MNSLGCRPLSPDLGERLERKTRSLVTHSRDPRPIATHIQSPNISSEEDEGVRVPRRRDRMQTPKQRPLLPTSQPAEHLPSPTTAAKSLFHRIFRVTPTRSRFCTNLVPQLLSFDDFAQNRGEGVPPGVSSGFLPPGQKNDLWVSFRKNRCLNCSITRGVMLRTL